MNALQVMIMAGPSSHGLDDALKGEALWLPPARRGDVRRLVDESTPGVLVLCDGVFDAVPAVSHAELCLALDEDWKVWGVSSLGAIRAWEMRSEGMEGFGHVYSLFERLPDFSDDEMCLLHCPEEPYFPVTEALVNVRMALEEHAAACNIASLAAEHLLQRLSALWFGDRREELIAHILVDECGLSADDVQRWLALLSASRIKNRDLAALLRAKPWQHAAPG